MTGGRLKLDVLAAGSVVPPFQIADAVHGGILDGGHGVAALRYNKHKASALFGTPPSFGWDSHGFLAWFYYGGGEALYRELLNGILKLNLVGLLYFPMPTQPLGWFRKEIKSADDLKGVRYRTVGAFRGGVQGARRGGDHAAERRHRAGDGARRARRNRVQQPVAPTLQLGLPDVAKIYMMGSHHRQVGGVRDHLQQGKVRRAAVGAEGDPAPRRVFGVERSALVCLRPLRQGLRRDQASAASMSSRPAEQLLEAQLKAWDQVIAERSKEPFFAKVIASQKAWVKRTGPFLHANNLDSEALSAAYRHFFG